MGVATSPIVPRDGTITIADNTGTPIVLTVAYEDGDLQIDGLNEGQTEVVEFKDRGRFYAARKTEDKKLTFTFTCHATQFSDSTEKLILDVVRKTGAFASGVSMLPAAAGGTEVWAVKLTFTAERTDNGATTDSSVVLKYCRLTAAFAEGIPAKFTVTGELYNYSTDFITIAA